MSLKKEFLERSKIPTQIAKTNKKVKIEMILHLKNPYPILVENNSSNNQEHQNLGI